MWQNKKIMTATALEQILRDQQEELFSRDESQLVTRREEQEFDLESQLAQIVIGVRRCGKSTLCQKVLKESGVNFAYVNFDDETLASLQADQLNDVIQALYRIYVSSRISLWMKYRMCLNGTSS